MLSSPPHAATAMPRHPRPTVQRACAYRGASRKASSPARHCMFPTAASLATKRCQPCEESSDAMEFMGMCRAMDPAQAQTMRAQLDDEWQLQEDKDQHLRLSREYRTRNFVSALELCNRIGDIAEQEGHHPDLHIESWNRLRVEVWTHSSKGVTENDFILAAKIDALDKADLLSKKKKATLAES